MQINPKTILDLKILKPSAYTKMQQVGIDLTLSEEIFIPNRECRNVLFNEDVDLPKNIFMTFNQRSSYSRKGIFCTTGIYDPGFYGKCGCTIYNMSGESILIPKNERIGQAIFWQADSASTYNGQWQGYGSSKE